MARAKRRPDGRYGARVNLGNGKYKYVCANSQKELEEKITQIKLKLGKGLDLAAERDTFGEWGKLWLEQKKLTVSAGMYNAYAGHFKKFEELYHIPVTKLRLNDFQQIIFTLGSGDKPLSKKTLNGLKQTAAQILQLAIDNRVIDYNCANAIVIPTTAKPPEKRRALTSEEQRWIRETPHRAQTAAMIMMYAGLRRGELLPLMWSDIDFERKTISVNKAVAYVNGKPQVKNCGKTDAALRTVFVPDVLIDYLKGVKRETLLVCPSTKGVILTEIGWKRLWESYLKELNFKYGDFVGYINLTVKSKYQPGGLPMVIPNITAHWLRHTFITNMYFAGISLMTAKEQAGHADIRTTSEIYTHLDDEYKERDMQGLNDYLKMQSV